MQSHNRSPDVRVRNGMYCAMGGDYLRKDGAGRLYIHMLSHQTHTDQVLYSSKYPTFVYVSTEQGASLPVRIDSMDLKTLR